MLAPGGVRAFSGRRHLVRSRRHARGGPVRLGGLPLWERRDADRPDLTTTNPGQVPSDLGDNDWKYAATPEDDNPPVNGQQSELCGVRGASLSRRSHDLEYGDRLRAGGGEDRVDDHHRPPRRDDRGPRLRDQVERRRARWRPALQDAAEPAASCPTPNTTALDDADRGRRRTARRLRRRRDDANGDGVFNLRRLRLRRPRQPRPGDAALGPVRGMLDPQDLMIAFSRRHGRRRQRLRRRHRRLGLPRQRQRPVRRRPVRARHRRGAGLDRRGGQRRRRRHLPELHGHPAARRRQLHRRRQPLRAGRPLRHRQRRRWSSRRRSARSTTAALAREAVDYAYDHGVTVIASAADEAAQHNNWPSSLPHVIVVNSVTQVRRARSTPRVLPRSSTAAPTSAPRSPWRSPRAAARRTRRARGPGSPA